MVLLTAALLPGCGGGGSISERPQILLGQLVLNPAAIKDAGLLVGKTKSTTVAVTNSGPASITVSKVIVTGSGLSIGGLLLPVTLTAHQSISFVVSFAAEKTGAFTGSISLVSDASNSPTLLVVAATALDSFLLSASPGSVGFGQIAVGSSREIPVTLANTGTGTVTVSQAELAGIGFTLSGLVLPATLAPGQTAPFNVTCSPKSAGPLSASLSLISNASNSPAVVSLSAIGATLLLTTKPSAIDFGAIVVGTRSTLPVFLYNTGTGSITISEAVVTGSGFSASELSLPLTLAPAESSQFQVIFAPAVAGTYSGNVSIISDAVNSPANEPVSGTGIHAVSLSWAAATEAGIAGYNIYRATAAGGPYSRLNPGLVSETSYTDNEVNGGQTYYYVATSVDRSQVESAYSNQATAVVPLP